MSSKSSSELRQLAIMIWQIWCPEGKEQRKREAAEQESRIERFRIELQRTIGKGFDISITINGGYVEAVIDNLRFIALELPSSGSQAPLALATLLGRCPSCGVETMSEPFYNLAGLGKMLEKFEPLFSHICISTGQYAALKK